MLYNTCGFKVSTIAMILSICSFSFTTCRHWCISSTLWPEYHIGDGRTMLYWYDFGWKWFFALWMNTMMLEKVRIVSYNIAITLWYNFHSSKYTGDTILVNLHRPTFNKKNVSQISLKWSMKSCHKFTKAMKISPQLTQTTLVMAAIINNKGLTFLTLSFTMLECTNKNHINIISRGPFGEFT